MSQTIFLRGAKQVLTLRGPGTVRREDALHDLGVILDGSMLIREGRIISVGTTRRLENLKEAKQALEIPVHGKIIVPGFVDAGMCVSPDRSAEGRKPRRSTEFGDYCLSLMRSCLQHGTVTACVHASADTGDTGADVGVLRKLGRVSDQPVRVFRGWRTFACAGSSAGQPLPLTLAILQKRRFIDGIAIAASEAQPIDPEAAAPLRTCGLRRHLIWHGGALPVLESALDLVQPAAVCLTSPPAYQEARLLALRQVLLILPVGKQVLEGSVDPAAVRHFLDCGGALALSSGYYTARAPNFNMQMAIALAVMRLGLTAEEAFAAATVNAAHAAGQSATTGTLEPGKRADVLILNLSDLSELPQQFGVNHVAMVLRSGNIVLNRTRWRAPESSANRMRPKPV